MKLSNSNPVKVYYTISSAASFANALIFTVIAIYYVKVAGLDPLQLVLVGTIVEATVFICEVPTGVLADSFSRRLSVITGLLLTGLAFGMQGLTPFFGGIALAQVIWGLGATFISGANDAWLADEIGPERLAPVYLRNSQLCQVSGLAGTLASVGLASVQLNLPILLSGLVYLLTGLLLVFFMPETGFKPLPRPAEAAPWRAMLSTFVAGARAVRGRAILIFILLVGIGLGASSEGFDRLWEAYLITGFGLDGQWGLPLVVWFGIISVGGQVLSLLAVEIYRRRTSGINGPDAARVLAASYSVTIAAILTLAFSGHFLPAILALWVKSIAGSIAGPLYSSWLAGQIPSPVRATVLSMSSQTDALGQIAGGPVVGLIGRNWGLRAALVTAGLLLLPVTALFLRARAAKKGLTTF